MLSRSIRLLDFDGSVARQAEFLSGIDSIRVPLGTIGQAVRLWADKTGTDRIRHSLDLSLRNTLTFLGSGDYHHVSALLLEQFSESISVIVFDHHPDWDRLPPRRGCGAWVSRALEQVSIKRVLLVGNASNDLRLPSLLTGNLPGLRSGRIVSLPWELPPQPCFNTLSMPWRELKSSPLATFSRAIDALPTQKVYVSIDKDCLRSPFALSNWEEGCLDLSFLLSALRLIRERFDIVGADVTGEFSPARFSSVWKALCSHIDHPAKFSARGKSSQEIDRINGSTNLQLLNAFIP